MHWWCKGRWIATTETWRTRKDELTFFLFFSSPFLRASLRTTAHLDKSINETIPWLMAHAHDSFDLFEWAFLLRFFFSLPRGWKEAGYGVRVERERGRFKYISSIIPHGMLIQYTLRFHKLFTELSSTLRVFFVPAAKWEREELIEHLRAAVPTDSRDRSIISVSHAFRIIPRRRVSLLSFQQWRLHYIFLSSFSNIPIRYRIDEHYLIHETDLSQNRKTLPATMIWFEEIADFSSPTHHLQASSRYLVGPSSTYDIFHVRSSLLLSLILTNMGARDGRGRCGLWR